MFYMKTTSFFFAFYLVLINYVGSDNTTGPIINSPQGDIQGIWKTTINGRKIQAFMGIPYAKAPVGQLRFKNPEPFGSWTSVWDGTKESAVCPQTGMGIGLMEMVTGNEDCLYLNVYTPDTSEKGKYPVIFFIHGGGYVAGASLANLYGPDMLLDKDIVLVVANYRLGLLGFGSTEDSVLPGNLGLKDQVLVLKWIKENVAAYGGNAESVTIFGQSAGGSSVHYHMLSPLSKDLFHRAIPMSGTADNPWAISAPGKNLKYLKKFGEKLNCSTSSSKELLDCLKDIPASVLVSTAFKFLIWEGMDPMILFTPVFEAEGENSFITAKDHMSHSSKPMMTGVTSEEGSLVIAKYHLSPMGISKVLSRLDTDFNRITPVSLFFDDKAENPTEVATEIKRYFFGETQIDKNLYHQLVNMFSDALFYEGEKSAIKRHDGIAYLYKFAYNGEHSTTEKISAVNFRNGVSHMDELQYIFPLKAFTKRRNKFTKEDKITSEQLINYITNFATNGNPTPEREPMEWKPRGDNNDYLLINGSDTVMQMNFLSERNDFWKNIKWFNKLYPQV